jgi:predicted nuclease of predicted toxin-antitoxin system
MLVLFDQGTPVPIRRFLKNHTVRTAAQEGWDRIANGDLIIRAEAARFDVLLTTDKNLEYQQNLKGTKLRS